MQFRCLNNSFQIWKKTQGAVIFNRSAVNELKMKDEIIDSLQSQLRKAVAELHEFETRSEFSSLYVAERALNR